MRYHKAAQKRRGKEANMKAHKFWAWAAAFCFVAALYTGMKHI